ncbi:MAG TPA: VIT domain-containing protein, partial [Polyangiales bacterium]|nr:VIT domain-containing protein [Polyangiales bacterium]
MASAIARKALFVLLLLAFDLGRAHAAGTLAPIGSGLLPMRIVDHHVEVLIDNGYARTEVTQVFQNPNPGAVEAVYSLPLPDGAALSELTAVSADQTLYGEVVARDRATQIYEQQVEAGAQAGIALKEGYQRFEFRIARIPAGEQATLTFAYYQTLEIDAGVGRYLYPLEEGGTDPDAAFWTRNDVVDGGFSAHVSLRSAFPIADVRVPDFEDSAQVVQASEGKVEIELDAQRNLDRDLVLYYRLADDLPGRVEVIPYR